MNASPQKAALVTGAAKRLGRAIALGLAADGWNIAVHYRESEDDARTTVTDIIALDRDARIRKLGCDQHLAVQLMQQLTNAGITAVAMAQTVKTFSDPMKWVFAHTLSGRIHHDNNPVMNWMVSNVTARVDANDNLFPRKERADNKIDGVVAMLMAMYLAKSEPDAVEFFVMTA